VCCGFRLWTRPARRSESQIDLSQPAASSTLSFPVTGTFLDYSFSYSFSFPELTPGAAVLVAEPPAVRSGREKEQEKE
jgi:hypothetical protein